MKTGYLISAVAITVLILIIAFQNIQNKVSIEMLFNMKNVSLALPILILVVLGIAAGSLYTLAIQSMINQKQTEMREDEESEF